MSEQLLTVCLITYNHANYIEEALDSILMQEVDVPWGLVIADDFSTDGTRKILEQYQKKHPKLIKLILQDKNYGPQKNWLDLMAEPKSEYVLYAEGDDYFTDPNKFQKQIDFLEAHKDFAICFHPVRVVYEGIQRPDEIYPSSAHRFDKEVLGLEDILTRNFIQTNSVMYRWGFNDQDIRDNFPKQIFPGDWYLHILHALNGKIGFIPDVMAVYRRHTDGAMWGLHTDNDKFMLKYGVDWLGMHVAVMEACRDRKEVKRLAEGSVITMLNTIVALDQKYGEHKLLEAITRFPEAFELYTYDLKDQATQLIEHSEKQATIIQHYVDMSNALKDENLMIKNRSLVKLDSAMRRHIKRSNK